MTRHPKFEGVIPSARLRAWCEQHAERVAIVHYGAGFATDTGMAYEVCLRNGWCTEEEGLHSIIEQTAATTLAKLRQIKPCACEACEKGESFQ